MVPSASLIPHDPTVLFTIAGMVPFKPYFLGEERAPWPRATSVQKCFRTVDIDIIGTTQRHCTFFEMLGNFSFGDYFKADAIPFAWELLTEALGVEADRLWVTVHESDDEAEEIWRQATGVDPLRVQRMGADNFWRMGETGPCGPCSELFYDRGPDYGADGGPAYGGAERFVEIYNLVFMQYNRVADGTLSDLPRKSIDTGAGLERMLPMLQGVGSLFDTDVFRPILAVAEELTGQRYGADEHADVSLRILADHARAMAMVVADGVLPSNEGRGYVLRRVIRRTVRRAFQLGVLTPVTPPLVAAVATVLGSAHPTLVSDLERIQETVEREEGAFRRTLDAGSVLLEEALRSGRGGCPATWPSGCTTPTASPSSSPWRWRPRRASRSTPRASSTRCRPSASWPGPTHGAGASSWGRRPPTAGCSTPRGPPASPATSTTRSRPPCWPCWPGQTRARPRSSSTAPPSTPSPVARWATPAPSPPRRAAPGSSTPRPCCPAWWCTGPRSRASCSRARRPWPSSTPGGGEATRRHHTGTHLLHSALRRVLGDHVRQQGSLVAPDRLRFDFSHPEGVAPEALREVAELANAEVLTDAAVEVLETSKAEAEALGALAFFGDKYGERVRVVRAGARSTELCGGTHVGALGMIGPITIVSEGSIGSNTRRIEAVAGAGALGLLEDDRRLLDEAARLLRVEPAGVVDALQKVLDRQRQADKELQRMRGRA